MVKIYKYGIIKKSYRKFLVRKLRKKGNFMSSLKLIGVSKTYPSGEKALQNVTLETAGKELLVILGIGEMSGKSTLLRVIAGLEDITEGQVFIDGKDVSDLDSRERDVALVFRNDNLNNSNTVFDN